MEHAIQDYGLTPVELEEKYEKLGHHPIYTPTKYRKEKATLAYWEWVQRWLQIEEDELANDSPYNF